MSLQILGTLPGFRRHGYATKLVRWGMDRAASDKVVLTLNASPEGHGLYSGLGFQVQGTQKIQAAGEKLALYLKAMVYIPEEGKRKHLELL